MHSWTLLGPDAKDLVTSSDAVADQKERAEFVKAATEKTKLKKDPADPNRITVLIGADEFPTAIPLVRRNGRWFWDVVEGRNEVLLRRVGGNELDAITVCRGFVEAQWLYAALDPDKTGVRQYAQKIMSSPGKHDGLYWAPEAGGPESPIGDAVARAIAQGYSADKSPQPYHGYYFKVLTAQGPSAPLGEMDFMVRGHMIGGFALIAWPRTVPQQRREDVHGRQRRSRLRAGSRPRHGQARVGHHEVRSGQGLDDYERREVASTASAL
jgi:hypothetical protein